MARGNDGGITGLCIGWGHLITVGVRSPSSFPPPLHRTAPLSAHLPGNALWYAGSRQGLPQRAPSGLDPRATTTLVPGEPTWPSYSLSTMCDHAHGPGTDSMHARGPSGTKSESGLQYSPPTPERNLSLRCMPPACLSDVTLSRPCLQVLAVGARDATVDQVAFAIEQHQRGDPLDAVPGEG